MSNSSRVFVCAIWRTVRGAGFPVLSAWQRKQTWYSALAGVDSLPLIVMPRTPSRAPESAPVVVLLACGLWQSWHSTCWVLTSADSPASWTPVVSATL